MEKRCLLNNCDSSSSDNKLFKFPPKNSKLRSNWIKNIPRNLYKCINKSSQLCDKHFQKKDITRNNKGSKLQPLAVPSIFKSPAKKKSEKSSTKSESKLIVDIFCLKLFKYDDREIAINNFVRNQFLEITQTELSRSKDHPQTICELCCNSLDDWAKFKLKLIQNQETLEGGRKPASDEGAIAAINEIEAVTVKVEPEQSDDEVSFGDAFEDVKSDKLAGKSAAFAVKSENQHSKVRDKSPALNRNKRQPVVVKKPGEGSKSVNRKVCDICGVSYVYLKRHFDRIHLRQKDFCCDICGYRTFKKHNLKDHIESHFKKKNHFCSQCSAGFTTSAGLKTHMLVHSKSKDFACDLEGCNASFVSRERLKRHLNSHLRFKTHECSECSRDFTDTYKLKRHMEALHPTVVPPKKSPCPECGKVFKSSPALAKHMVYHKPPEFRCETCGKVFFMAGNLKTHIKTNHGGSKDYECKYCDCSYFKNSHLNRHILTVHMKQKIHCQVDSCKQHYPLKELYRAHILSHHHNLGEKETSRLIEESKSMEMSYENTDFQLNLTLLR